MFSWRLRWLKRKQFIPKKLISLRKNSHKFVKIVNRIGSHLNPISKYFPTLICDLLLCVVYIISFLVFINVSNPNWL